MGHAMPGNMISLCSAALRHNVLAGLQRIKEQRERELQAAENSPFPNKARIASLRAAVQNLTGTLNRAQR